ncbi:unnamed protein product [Aphanomyces euteiches]
MPPQLKVGRSWESNTNQLPPPPLKTNEVVTKSDPYVNTSRSKRERAKMAPKVQATNLSLGDFIIPKKQNKTKENTKGAIASLPPPPPPSSATPHNPPADAIYTPQVVTKKKKRPSTLKKRVIRDREEKWIAYHASKLGENPVVQLNPQNISSVQVLHLVDPDEVEDEDEYGDTLDDTKRQFQTHGDVQTIEIDRSSGTVTVEYANPESASAAVSAFNNIKFGGQVVSCYFYNPDNMASLVIVSVQGFCEPEELADDDELEEVLSDIRQTFSSPHIVQDLTVDRSTGEISLMYSSPKEAKEVATIFHGKTFGGKPIIASWNQNEVPPNEAQVKIEVTNIPPVRRLPNAQEIREYVDQGVDKGGEMETMVIAFLNRLMSLQERARLTNPLKAKKSRRLVFGLREVKRGLKTGKVVCLLVAYNIDECASEGGMDEKVIELINLAREMKITVIFILSKRQLGKALLKTIRVSCVGIYNVDGANELWSELKAKVKTLQSAPDSPEENSG